MSCHDIDQHGIDGQRFFYTRKKDRFSIAPGDYDMIAWRHDRESESCDPTLAFRDRLTPDIWITKDEFDRQRREISNANIPVSSQRGSLPVDPAEGRYAWFRVPGHPGRRRHVMDGGRWPRTGSMLVVVSCVDNAVSNKQGGFSAFVFISINPQL